MLILYSAPSMSAMFAEQDRAIAMPCCPTSMPAMSMGMTAATIASLVETGVHTSVSLFVVIIILGLLLLVVVGLVVLISLLLTRLTGLIRLESLVGLNGELATNATQGD